MTILLTIVHVFVCLVLIGVVLLQSGRAGGMGVLSGASTQTVFGGRGAGSFLQRVTAICAILFIVTCSTMAWMASATRDRALRNSAATAPATPARPAHPAGATAPASGTTNGAAPAADNGTGPAPADNAGTAAPSAPSAPANAPSAPANGSAPANAPANPTP